ncbi:integral membrane sensor signal transduction histidine kinase [Paucilactobacillus oligofermentans DSM 15707 = LMG 22743]|uniref:Signal transduction histidine-protein kinase ArlS n=1 Tax=Paucilactobacillus oligofermentans DSM 15707 = LMG 22743 TaxID=1423778 RepID=A0A0R1RGT9_9LACO|nr:integral membrane sensor signal transduction histidine kinase [Paucilactobacillus oligofermentans DSM 15707 = LMG 22743]CUS26070.1 Putative signal transduction histidine-protein kinase ArlS [Paucilactobacillus oligofermentans DSM 15707 = LMG 22743]
MKNIEKSKKSEYRLSLKVKWALGTALGALVIFASLTFVLFSAFTDNLLDQEKLAMNNSLVHVKQQLEKNDTNLNSASINKQLGNSQSVKINRNITQDLSTSNTSITVFNIEGERIYATGKIDKKFKPIKKQTIGLTGKHFSRRLVGGEPIISEKTNQVIGYVYIENSLTAFYKIFNKMILISILTIVLMVIASGLLGYFLSYFLLGPIDDIHDTLVAIRDDPTADNRVPKLHRHDELADMAVMFNEMMDRMQRYMDQQSQFVGDVSHELRTPVAIIQGHMELLNRWGKDDPAVLAESIDASLKETKRMQDLVQEMLDLSRAEQIETNFNDEKTEVSEVVHQVFNNFKIIHPDFLFIMDDDLRERVVSPIYRDHLEQILIILSDNAVKYSTNHKEIHMSLSRTLNRVEIGVQDFGEGISKNDMGKVFDRFYRVDKARSRKKGGNGLGLSIAKRLVEGYGGEMTLESSPGYGSLFKVTLPIIDEDIKTLDDY